jgi:hypothetical protein
MCSRSSSWKRGHLRRRHLVEVAVDPRPDRDHLLLHRPRAVLRLVQGGDHPLAAGERALRRLVELGAELRERLQLAVLGELELQAAGDLAHRLHLALPPTRETEMPTLIAGRTPE